MTDIQQFRRKDEQVQAVQITSDNAYTLASTHNLPFQLSINGVITINVRGVLAHTGDWIACSPTGEPYIIPAEELAASYVPVEVSQ